MEGREGHSGQREQDLHESAFWRAGRWLVGCGIGSSRGGRKGAWEQLIQGFVGQAESFAPCSVSDRKPPKVFVKAEEGRARKTILGEARSG